MVNNSTEAFRGKHEVVVRKLLSKSLWSDWSGLSGFVHMRYPAWKNY